MLTVSKLVFYAQSTSAVISRQRCSQSLLLQKEKTAIGSPGCDVSVFDIYLRTLGLGDILPWTCRSQGKWRSKQTGGQSNHHKWLASRRKIWSVEKLETLPSYGHKAKDITPSIAWRREAWKEEAFDKVPWQDERGPSSVRRTQEMFRRQCWGNLWEMGWSAYELFRVNRYHLELNWI